MSNPLKQLAGQTAIYGLTSILGRFLNYLLVPLYTNVFITSEYGVVTDLYAYVGFLLVLLTYGMETAFFRYAEKNKTRKAFSSAAMPLAVTSSVFIFFVIIFSQNIADLLKYPDNKEYIIWFALIIGIDAYVSIFFAKLRRENKAVKFVVFKFINIGLNIGLNLFFLLLCPKIYESYPESYINAIYSPDTGVGYIFISNLIASAVSLVLFIPEILKTSIKFSPELLKQMLVYGSPLLFAGLAGMINEVIDRILLKYLIIAPETAVDSHKYIMSQIGIYGANYKLSILMTLFIQAFRYAAEPFFFAHEKEKAAKKTYSNVMTYFVIFGLLIFLGIMLYIDIAKYFIHESYHEGLHIVPILLAANLFLGIIYNLSVWYKLTNKTKYAALIAGTGALVTLVLNFILIPEIGYLGSAWATFACYLTMMIISFFLGRKYFRIEYNLMKIALYFVVAGGIWLLSIYVELNGLIKYAFNTILLFSFIGFVVYRENLLKVLKIRK